MTTRRIRMMGITIVALPSLVAALARSAAAEIAPLLAQGTGGAGNVTQVVQGRSYVVEILLVLALFGAALFAVCKASRRS